MVATILVIGMIVGLTTLRNQVVQELIAVGEAIGCLNTSYSITGLAGNPHGEGFSCWTGTSYCADHAHFCFSPPITGGWAGGITDVASTQLPGLGGNGLLAEE